MKRVMAVGSMVAGTLMLALVATSANLFGANMEATSVSGEYALDLVDGFTAKSVTRCSPNTCIMNGLRRYRSELALD